MVETPSCDCLKYEYSTKGKLKRGINSNGVTAVDNEFDSNMRTKVMWLG